MSKAEIKNLEEQKAKILRQLRETEEGLEKAKAIQQDLELEELKPLAEQAHDLLCGWNHTDGCGWHYEIDRDKTGPVHNWRSHSHASWLERVKKWLEPKRYGITLTKEKLGEILAHAAAGKRLHSDYLFILREIVQDR